MSSEEEVDSNEESWSASDDGSLNYGSDIPAISIV
jgi:hypothetical protein